MLKFRNDPFRNIDGIDSKTDAVAIEVPANNCCYIVEQYSDLIGPVWAPGL